VSSEPQVAAGDHTFFVPERAASVHQNSRGRTIVVEVRNEELAAVVLAAAKLVELTQV